MLCRDGRDATADWKKRALHDAGSGLIPLSLLVIVDAQTPVDFLQIWRLAADILLLMAVSRGKNAR